MKPSTPQLKAHIKTHKEDMPIRPVVNNVNAPSHNIAKQLNQQLYILLPLPNTYTVKKFSWNSTWNSKNTHKWINKNYNIRYKGHVRQSAHKKEY